MMMNGRCQVLGRGRLLERWFFLIAFISHPFPVFLLLYQSTGTPMVQVHIDHGSMRLKNTLKRTLSPTSYKNREVASRICSTSSHLRPFMFLQSSGFALKALLASLGSGDIMAMVFWESAKLLLGFHFQGFQLSKSATVSLYTQKPQNCRAVDPFV